ncbi:MAG: porin [Bacteroidota bacterium]
MVKKLLPAFLLFAVLLSLKANAQTDTSRGAAPSIMVPQQPSVTSGTNPMANAAPLDVAPKKNNWYDNISIRGYMQIRYNRLLETNDQLKCEQCDKSWGRDGGFFMRRMRIIFFGQVSKKVYFYVQPDFASSASTTGLHFGQIRDAYVDLGLDDDNEFRFRIGQSKVPFGFENMQSSQNRLSLDRNDALNSAVSNERDMGVFFYWAPKKTRDLFASLVRDGLKGSGDYGVFALGAYNGQTANKPEANNELHYVTRLTYPFQFNSQIVEASVQAYTGKYTLYADQLTKGVGSVSNLTYLDQRAAATFVLYPKPFGVQAEYNIGKGPEFNKTTGTIETQNLSGGYLLLNYRFKFDQQLLFPFIKYQVYDGGKKFEKDARSYNVEDYEFGIEWQPYKTFELVAIYTVSNRRFEDYALQNNHQKGQLLRIQAQLNF